VDLVAAVDHRDGRPPSVRPCTRLFFRLSALAERLAEYVKVTPMSAHALAMSQVMLDEGLPDICVSHPTEWGIPVPVEGFESHKIYVWFEMAAGYLWAAAHSLDLAGAQDVVARAAKVYNQPGTPVVHFYGFDNTFYHTLLFPAVHLALDWGLKPPSAHVVNELLDLGGKKFSTSRLHLIWGRDLLDRVPADYVRWFLCESRPEGLRADFSLPVFCESVNRMFPGSLRRWGGDLAESVRRNFNGRMPEPGAWTAEHREFYATILNRRSEILAAYTIQGFSPRRITSALRGLAEDAVRFGRAQSCMAGSVGLVDYLRKSIALSALALKVFALLARPVVPETTDRLLAFLATNPDSRATDTSFLAGGTVLGDGAGPELPTILEEDLREIQHHG
jgi:methionyl-tRNA synthetase